MSGTLRLSILIEAIDRASRPMAGLQARLAGVAGGIMAVRQATQRLAAVSGVTVLAGAFGNLAGRARDAAGAIGGAAGRLALLAGGGALAFNRLFVRGAADFENYGLTLRTVMGDAEAAQRRLNDLVAFASNTPFSVAQVVDAGVQLQVLGLRGAAADRALRAAGDAAVVFAQGRLPEAVTALAAAMRGEMDPIERFGVQARTVGNQLLLEWGETGRRVRAAVDKNNREEIARVVTAAWRDVAPNAAAEYAQGWDGMISNLGDAWSNFTRRIAQSGPFDWLKEQLRDLLALIGRLEADGTLARWAQEAGAAITRVFQAMRDFVVGTEEAPGALERLRAIFARLNVVIGPIVDRFGGLETFLVAVGVVLAGPLLGALASLTAAMVALGIALAATPAGWFAIAAAGIVLLGKALYDNWDSVVAVFRRLGAAWESFANSGQIRLVRQAFGDAADWISERWGEVSAAFTGFGDNVRRTLRDIAGYFQPLIDAVNWLLDRLPSLGGGRDPGPRATDAASRPTAAERRALFGRRGAAEGFYGPAALGGEGSLPPSSPVRLDAGLDVTIRLPDGLSATVTPRGGDMDVRADVRRGTLAVPVP